MPTMTISLVLAALLSLPILSGAGALAPPVKVTNTASQCNNGVPTIIVTLDSLTWSYYQPNLYYHNPAASPTSQRWPSSTSMATFNVPTGRGSFQITTSPSTGGSSSGIIYYNAPCGGPPKKGMTWYHMASDAQYGTITVGCGAAGPDRCDAAKGDTPCSQQLPVLCIYKPNPAFQKPVGLKIPNIYMEWSGGVVATTRPIAGDTFANSAAVTEYCRKEFGAGWRVAEFHDAVYWYFQAYGGTVSAPTVPSTRFWVHINDQPDGNCWQLP